MVEGQEVNDNRMNSVFMLTSTFVFLLERQWPIPLSLPPNEAWFLAI